MKKNRLLYPVCWLIFTVVILAVTLLNRHPRGFYNYSIHLFWSYRLAFQGQWWFIWQVTANILLFFPEGFFGALLLKEKNKPAWLMVIFGFLLSAAIEAAQYYWQLGYAEMDDLFSNTLGTVLGVLAASFLRRNRNNLSEKSYDQHS